MKWHYLFFLFFFACSCKQNNKTPTLFDDSNVYSNIIDYCETHPIDSSRVYTGEEDYIPYCHLGLNGKTLHEVISIFGTPINEIIDTFYVDTRSSWDDYLMNTITNIVKNCGNKVPVYMNVWKPRKNKEIGIWIYFVKDGDKLRVVYAEQENERKRIME